MVTNTTRDISTMDGRLERVALYRWWRTKVVGSVEHEAVVSRIVEDSRWSPRYAFMTMMSAGIAVLGLLLSSPAVVIGAMLISPLMSPILGLGFSLALFDFAEMRRATTSLVIGSVVAVAFTTIIVLASPLKAPTAEILARTRPNLFDLLVALFAALAGTFAIIRGRGETIVGVAIAAALMPPLAVVGYGLATANMAVLGGSLALFVTNLLTIALAATIMARFYGFGHHLSGSQSWTQTVVLLLAFVAMAIPLGFALNQIARETVAATQVRSLLTTAFGATARVTQLDINFDRTPISIRAVIIAPRTNAKSKKVIEAALTKKLGRPISLQLDQVLLDPGAGALETQRAELRRVSDTEAAAAAAATSVARLVGLAAGVAPDKVTLDRDHHRATATATALPGASADTYRAIESRATNAVDDWTVEIVPPLVALPIIRFADDSDVLDQAGRDAVMLSAWESRRWNITALAVPGLPETGASLDKPSLAARRAMAIAAVLKTQGIATLGTSPTGQNVVLTVAHAGSGQ